jgi:fructokinase
MRKIIAIGESILDTIYYNNRPECTFVGGRVSNAAASLGELGLPVSMVSECCTDKVGDWVVDFFKSHNVDTNSVDRYTDGSTPLAAIFKQDDAPDDIVNYGVYPGNRFNVIWPRIDENDIVLFGSYYAIDEPQRERLFDLLSYASDRKAILIYLPGFQHGTQFNLTKVMPNILENFEVSTFVIDHDKDINNMFPDQDSDKVYNNHIKFYGPTYIHINPGENAAIYQGGEKLLCPFSGETTNYLGWQAGFIAGFIYALFVKNMSLSDINTLTPTDWQELMKHAFDFAKCCEQSPSNCITPEFAREKAQLLPSSNETESQLDK